MLRRNWLRPWLPTYADGRFQIAREIALYRRRVLVHPSGIEYSIGVGARLIRPVIGLLMKFARMTPDPGYSSPGAPVDSVVLMRSASMADFILPSVPDQRKSEAASEYGLRHRRVGGGDTRLPVRLQ